MKKKELNILINSFTYRKLPLLELVKTSKHKIDKKIKIFLGNNKSFPYSSFFKKNIINLPLCKDKNRYQILKVLKKLKIKFVIPTSDAELIFWSKYKNFFKLNGIIVFISQHSSIKICLDKLSFHKYCKVNNIPDIKILTPKDYKKRNIKLVVKERFSHEKNKLIINKDYNYIKKHLHKYKSPIIQKFIPGNEISVDAFLDENHRVVGLFMRKREHVIDGESQVTSIFRNHKLEGSFTKYFESLKLVGMVMLQAKIYKNKPYIIECNPRVGGASTLSIQNGLDAFFWQMKKIINERFVYKFKKGKKNRLFRFPVDFYLK
jgi:carbamoyl-phosphate synthase large subunit